jgi:methionyl-tRNA formyltransferase
VKSERFIEHIRLMQPDLLALAAFGQIVPQALLDIPPYGPINVHGSLLPKYRGAAPIQRAIMAGERNTGVTTMWMDATLDTGDILLSAELDILPQDTSGTLFVKLANLGADLLIKTVEGLEKGTITRKPQNGSEASLAPMLQPEDGAIRWTEVADACVNRIRAVSPKPGAFAIIRDKRVKVWEAYAAPELTEVPPGQIVGFSKSPAGLKVSAGNGTVLILTESQPENGKRMAADAWARGLRLLVGDAFTEPA